MTNSRSFTEYVVNTFSNEFWAAAEEYLQQNWDPDEYDFYKIHRPGEPELDDVKVKHVWVFDQPGMCIQFDVAVSLHLNIGFVSRMQLVTLRACVRLFFYAQIAEKSAEIRLFHPTGSVGFSMRKVPYFINRKSKKIF